MINSKAFYFGSVVTSIGLIILGLNHVYEAFFAGVQHDSSILKPIHLPKVAEVKNSNFRLDPSAFSYEITDQAPSTRSLYNAGIESAKLLGTVIGKSSNEHVAFVALPQSEQSKLVKIGDIIMNRNCIDIQQHHITFDDSPHPIILHLSGFGPKEQAHIQESTVQTESPHTPLDETNVSNMDKSPLPAQAKKTKKNAQHASSDDPDLMMKKRKRLEERYKNKPEILKKRLKKMQKIK
jgi:hypothetical protein